MKIEYYHASVYGNGARIAEELKRVMAAKGVEVNVHHVRDARPKEIPMADLYLFSSPGRFGKPIRDMRHFLKKVDLPPGSRYAILATEMNPLADKKTSEMATKEELGPCQQIIPRMNEMLQAKGLTKVADGKIFVTGIKGPLEDRWQAKVEEFTTAILRSS